MNWKKHLIKLKPGDKVEVINDKKSSEYYKIGNIVTLKFKYLDNGVWKGTYFDNPTERKDENYWSTTNSETGLEETDCRLVG